jgi:hypothetical protein
MCRAARQNGWNSCPTKSVPARMIEDAVVDRLRTAMGATEARERLNVAEQDWQNFEERPFGLVRALVEQVSYDGTTGAVELHLKRSETNHED